MRLVFLTWVSDAPSGGNLYDRELIAGLRSLGVQVVEQRILHRGSADPDPTRLGAALTAEKVTVIDGIVAGGAPEAVEAAVRTGRSITILVHHFGADRPDLSPAERSHFVAAEARALTAATGVLCTSHWAAGELARRYGLVHTGVALPGVARSAPSAGSRTSGRPRILALGSLTSTKDQLCLIGALSRVADLAWTARLVGSASVEPEYAARVRAAVTQLDLDDRVTVTGPLVGAELEAEWAAADLLVHPSRSETFGIVVLEALAHGIPAVVVAGTGAVEALATGRPAGIPAGHPPSAGSVFRAGDQRGLAAVLRSWLTDDVVAADWRSAALDQSSRLPTWSDTARAALGYLERRSYERSDPSAD